MTYSEFVYIGRRPHISLEGGVVLIRHHFLRIQLHDRLNGVNPNSLVITLSPEELPGKIFGYTVGDLFTMPTDDGGETYDVDSICRVSRNYLQVADDLQFAQRHLAAWTLEDRAAKDPRYYTGNFLDVLEEAFASVPNSSKAAALGYIVERLSRRL